MKRRPVRSHAQGFISRQASDERLAMVDLIQIWHYEHVRFAQLLKMLETEATAFDREVDPHYEMMRDILFYLRAYADRVHHPREDLVFSRLLTRAPELAATIEQLRVEHRTIAEKAESLHCRLDEILEDVVIPRVELAQSIAEFLALYRNHIGTEERDVLPSAARLLKGDDWSAAATPAAQQSDPLFGEDVLAPFRALRAQIDRDAQMPRG
jgi:hemerythrin-like domain-containing protein